MTDATTKPHVMADTSDWQKHIERLTGEQEALKRAIALAAAEADPMHAEALRGRVESIDRTLITLKRQDRERRAGIPVQVAGSYP